MKINIQELVTLVEQSHNPTLTAAIWYIEHGIPVLPATADGKLPSKTQLPGVSYQSAAITKDKAIQWFGEGGRFRGWNLSVPTGPNSGVCVIDIDNKNGKDGSNTWATLEAMYGELPEDTMMSKTPSGGIHIFFKHTEGFICGSNNVGEGVDTRGHRKDKMIDGGHILVYPSIKEEKPYEFLLSPDTQSYELSHVPAWVLDIMRDVRPVAAEIEIPDVIPQGGRDDFMYKFGLRLVARNYSEEEIRTHMEEVGKRLDPPDDRMVQEKIDSVLGSSIYEKQQTLQDMDLQVNDKGRPIKNALNLLKIIRSSLFQSRFPYKYDEFKKRIYVNSQKLDDDVHTMSMICYVEEEFGLGYHNANGPLSIYQTVIHAAMKYECFDSYKDYFMGLPRTKSDEPFNQFCELLGFDASPNSSDLRVRYLQCSLLAMVGRALEAGCKVDTIPVLCGGQGIGKSTLISELLPHQDWFTDDLSPDITKGGSAEKDAIMKLDGKAIVEAGEMTAFKYRGTHGHETASIKRFVSTTVDEYRTPYGRTPREYPRRFVVWGSTNADDFLVDTTGNRRYFPIPILQDIKPAVDWLRKNRDSLWGEMVQRYFDGERWFLSIEEEEKQSELNQEFMKHDVWTDVVLQAVAKMSRFSSEEVLINTLHMDIKDINNGHKERINAILRNSGQFTFKNKIKYKKAPPLTGYSYLRGHINNDEEIDKYYKGSRYSIKGNSTEF